jgi:hypothetical protein
MSRYCTLSNYAANKFPLYNTYVNFDEYPNEIIPNLFLGNTTHRNPRILNTLGITNIVTVNEEDAIPGYNNLVMKMKDSVNQRLFPTLFLVYNFINYHLSKGEKVLVHCTAGISRSASAVTYFIMKRYGMKFEDAYKLVKEKRPIVSINPGFESQLKSLKL